MSYPQKQRSTILSTFTGSKQDHAHSVSEVQPFSIEQSPSPPNSLWKHPGRHYGGGERYKLSGILCFGQRHHASDVDLRGTRRRPRFFWWFIAAGVVIMVGLILALGLIFGLRHAHASPVGMTVDLGYSKYVGTSLGDGNDQWLGIRYAAAPVGNLRWAAPQDPVKDGITYDASQYNKTCHQSPSTFIDNSRSEDCLFLNIYAPSNNTGSRPVYVYMVGGGFNGLADPKKSGAPLVQAADGDMIVVTFNYRVGVYGFLSGKEVQANGSSNAGLLDQRKALHWVQDHISKFGGDPKRVTLGGSSAGAASVNLHLSAYGGRNDKLFIAAASQSQSFGYQMTVSESQYQFDALSTRVGCDTSSDQLQCLRDLDIKTLASHNINIPTPNGGGGVPLYMYSPVVDGTFITNYTYELFTAGKFVHVPVIFGDDTNEGTEFTTTNISSTAGMHTFLKNQFPRLNDTSLATLKEFDAYNQTVSIANHGNLFAATAQAYGEMRYICPGMMSSTVFASKGLKSYNYHYDVLTSKNAVNGLGVPHTSEDKSIWGIPASPEAAVMMPTIQNYWVSFIRTGGNPNKYRLAGSPEWGVWSGTTMQRLHLPNDPASVAMEEVEADQKERCAFMNSLGGVNGQ